MQDKSKNNSRKEQRRSKINTLQTHKKQEKRGIRKNRQKKCKNNKCKNKEEKKMR